MKPVILPTISVKTVRTNLYKIITSNGVYIQSYNTIILFLDTKNTIYIANNWDQYSTTTTRHIAEFLGYNALGLRKAIKEGLFKAVKFNMDEKFKHYNYERIKL